jgi:tetrapyrrole methylase family protein / MazG family protein
LATIYVVGLGPGDLSGLPMGTYRQLQSGLPIYLRTQIHPVVDDLRQQGFTYTSFDDLYETGERFEEVYLQMADRLLAAAARGGNLVYAVPGHPLMAEQSVQNLVHKAPEMGVEIVIGPGQSFLDAVCTSLRLDPIEGFLLLDGTALSADALRSNLHTVIVQVFHRDVASDVKLSLMEVYDDQHPVTVIRAAGVVGQERVCAVPLHELDHLDWIDHLTSVYVPPTTARAERGRDPWFPVSLVRMLRSPDGCPWDRQQSHQSLRPYVIEEAYEVVKAIDDGDPLALADELGDLLLQVLLHAEIASEVGDFTVRDVFAALSDKLIRRHPHVFGDTHADTEQDAQASWDAAKSLESTDPTGQSALARVKWARPAHLVAVDLQDKAAEMGFDWPSVDGVLDKLEEEVAELRTEVLSGTEQTRADEFGDVLFTLANLARWWKLDLEKLLETANGKFAERFRIMEECIHQNGLEMDGLSLEILEKYWFEAKKTRKNANLSNN